MVVSSLAPCGAWGLDGTYYVVDGQEPYRKMDPDGTRVHAVLFDAKDARTMYAATDKGTYISRDLGTTWSELSSALSE